MRLISPQFKFVLIFLLLISGVAEAQDHNINIDWNFSSINPVKSDDSPKVLDFKNSQFDVSINSLPIYVDFFPVNISTDRVSVSLINPKYVVVPTSVNISSKDQDYVAKEIVLEHFLATTRKKRNVHFSMVPIRTNANGETEVLTSATVRIVETTKVSQQKSSGFSFVDQSKLSTGEWYKLEITNDGVYKMDYNYLNSLGVNVGSIDPYQINIYGNGGLMLPILNSVDRIDDLAVNAIQIVGGDDGSFDANDYILFYGKGPNSWTLNSDNNNFEHEKHNYSNRAYYYIGIGIDGPARIETLSEIEDPETHVVNSFNDHVFHEVDEVNLNKSGRELYGEKFDFQTSYTFNEFNFTNIDQASPVNVKARVINVTQTPNIGEFEMTCNGQNYDFTVNGHGSGDYHDVGIAKTVDMPAFNPTSDNLAVTINYQKDLANDEAYLDYIAVNARRLLIMSGSQLDFRDINSMGSGNLAKYELESASSINQIWDISDHINPKRVNINGDGNIRSFKATSDELKEFIAFKNSGFMVPVAFGQVENQDLHGLAQQDMIILTAPVFANQANDLADFHRDEGLLVTVVTPMEIYNEFSSGNPDITAIKSFCKMFYDRGTSENDILDYLLLLGDATYLNNTIDPYLSPLIISYQNQNSLDPLHSFITDDYYGYLDDDEGELLNHTVDVGIGRFPVVNTEQAEDIIRKIKLYSSANSQPVNSSCFSNENSTFGDWRTKMLFIADDGNGTTHSSGANTVANIVENNYKEYNINKIYIDSYQQETTTGGERYPVAEKDIRENIELGAQIVTYFGHGGEVGWAHERILDIPTINGFTNLNRLPVFLTATCEFSRFDDPDRTSAGELLILNPVGGAVALLSTSRPVYSQQNLALAKAFYNVVLEKDADQISYGSSGIHEINHGLRLGDVNLVTKNGIGSSENKRNFTLLGDPAMKMAFPKLVVEQDAITDDSGVVLTEIKALQKVTVTGHIEDVNGNLIPDYNGYVTPTVFDKPRSLETLVNDDESSSFAFTLQNNVLYKGNTTVENGVFSFTFIVPKDINYQEGFGRISYYALSSDNDALGYNYNSDSDQSFLINGQNEDAVEDTQGPEINLYLDNENFVDGGMTNENPILIAKFNDEHGINTSSSGIGHDITMYLDGDNQNTILLNDLYRADLDTYQSGKINYPIKDLSEGTHTLTVKVWDIYNNSSTKTISFEVNNASDLALENVVNYPNPFTTYTEFMFQHNQNCSTLDVDIQIFTVSGKLVKTIQNTLIPQHEGANESISWNGTDDFGDKLGRGVYVYKLKVKTPTGLKEEVFEKLVILN